MMQCGISAAARGVATQALHQEDCHGFVAQHTQWSPTVLIGTAWSETVTMRKEIRKSILLIACQSQLHQSI